MRRFLITAGAFSSKIIPNMSESKTHSECKPVSHALSLALVIAILVGTISIGEASSFAFTASPPPPQPGPSVQAPTPAPGGSLLQAPPPHVAESTVSNVRVSQFDLKDFPTVRLFVSVTDLRSLPIKNLAESNFELIENGVQVKELRFAHEELKNLPLSILFIVDVSGSMEKALADEIEAVRAFIENLKDKDRVALMKFSDAVITEVPFTQDKKVLLDALNHLFAFGQTRLYDAVFQGINLMLQEPEARKAIIVLSDGLDNLSTETVHTVTELYRTDVLEKNKSFSIFTLGLGEQIDVGGLTMVADATGGMFFRSPTSAELKSIYQTILEQILNEYVIAYESAERRKGALVEGTVKVTSGGSSSSDDFIFRSPGLGAALARLFWPGLLISGVLFVVLLILTLAKFMRAAWVTVMVAPKEGKDFPLRADVNLIGRAEDCQIRIRHDPGILPHHAEIRLTKDGFVLKALGDSLPLVNGVPQKTTRLSDKQEFIIGSTRVIMHERRLPKAKAEIRLEELIALEAEAEEKKMPSPEPTPANVPTSAIVVKGVHQGLTFELKDGLTIGRKDADVLLSEDRMVSRLHAKITIRAGKALIEDLGSTNGTFLNGRKLAPNAPATLNSGDLIQLGSTEIKLI